MTAVEPSGAGLAVPGFLGGSRTGGGPVQAVSAPARSGTGMASGQRVAPAAPAPGERAGAADAGTGEAGTGEAGTGSLAPVTAAPDPGGLGFAGFDTDAPPVGARLPERLTALARLIQIGSARSGPGGFSPELLTEAGELLARAGERVRMSSGHTVVALAGGTGSGKSSLFNVLAGADFSPSGVVRPMTRAAHACVWGMAGAGPLLDWLGVERRNRYARSSALDDGERALAGMVLLDLPDHDSVLAGTAGEVDRLVAHADLMVWVLDPQKYADAAVHSRYLVPMAGHAAVMAVVLNQADLLTAEQAEDCVADLQRLLDAEGLHDTRTVVTSAVTGRGIGELRKLLTGAVVARQAATDRLAADVDVLAARFADYVASTDEQAPADAARPDTERMAGPEQGSADTGDAADSGGTVAERPARSVGEENLFRAFAQAAGVAGVGRALQSARELRAVDYIGWPVSWLTDLLLRRDPVRKMRLGNLWDELRGVSAGPTGAQVAEVHNAITAFADDEGHGLPVPWPATVLQAARSRSDEIPVALGSAVARTLPAENKVSPWWRLVATWQGLLLGGAVVGLAWLGVLLAVGVFRASPQAAALFSDVALVPWAVAMAAGALALGWLTALGCMSLVAGAAGRERERTEERMRAEIAGIARQMVMMPVEQELSEYARFHDELAVARA